MNISKSMPRKPKPIAVPVNDKAYAAMARHARQSVVLLALYFIINPSEPVYKCIDDAATKRPLPEDRNWAAGSR
jgi:hypothetical protein